MEWQHPQWLYLILPLAAAWFGLSLYSRRCRRRAAEAFVAQAMWSRILPADAPGRFWSKLVLREMAIIAGLIALAGPRYGTLYEDVVPRGSDLYVLIDVSRSMLADDVPPSRLERAKADVAALVNRLEGERVGLIAFAGQAVVKCPLTVDYDAFRRSLDELDPGSAPRGGTAIGDAIRKALEVFQARAERDQAILLITDGDDQQSYPLEAAAVAAERHVTIFTVGLGDADQGARVPQTATAGAGAKSFVEYEGQQVWSKLDNKLLKDIALATSGVYLPVGTRAYDLGALYAEYLQGRRGGEGDTRKRLRRAEQFQIFLAVALLALIADLFIRPYAAAVTQRAQETPGNKSKVRAMPAASAAVSLLLCALLPDVGQAENPAGAVREGLQHYRADEFEKAREKFAAAREEFRKDDAAKSAIAAFDEACAAHRKGDVSQARDAYLQAGLAHDKSLAAASHFNLGTLSAEEARRLAGEHPETVPPEKRQEILDQLKAAVASFRHSLELQPSNARARRDIELVRQWIKYYSDKWHEQDRKKRRQEANLVAFLEFLIETQRGLLESVRSLPPTAPADAYAELKRLQEELAQEIPPLKEKIRADLQPQQAGTGHPGSGQPGPNQPVPGTTEELEQGLKLLEGWADAAGEKMSAAARKLDMRRAEPATVDQQGAREELEKIWEAVIPFAGLLARDLADQTNIAGTLKPAESAESEEDEKEAPDREPMAKNEIGDLKPLVELQEQTQRRTQLLKLKAEAELERLEKSPPPAVAQKEAPKEEEEDSPKLPDEEAASGPQPVDPAQLKAGFEKAIELAPQAAVQMETALKSLRQDDQPAAYPPAEEARKILEEIQKAQPKQEQQKEDQEKQDQDQQKQDEKQPEEQKPEEKKPDEKKKEEQKKDEKQDEQKQEKEAGKKPQPQPKVSRDQIEEALRKVRERQQDKRERDRKMKARMSGRAPVEKDW